MRAERPCLVAGMVLTPAALACAVLTGGDGLTGWLAAAVAFSAVPAGALTLSLMMRLIPGAWGEELRLTTEAATLLTPVAALFFIPVLIGMAAIYPWVDGQAQASAFRAWWLTPLPFVLRTLIRFAAQFEVGRRMRRRRHGVVTASIGLIVLPLLASVVAVDWLASLDPQFASSAFGAQFITREVTIAFCVLILLRLSIGRPPRRLAVLGGLLLTLLLLWGYFAFLPFFIHWSGNLPPGVAWYAARFTSGWRAVTTSFGVLGGIPAFALLFGRVRKSAELLRWCAGAVLVGELLELAWIALPGTGAAGPLVYLVALAGLGLLIAGGLLRGMRRRIIARCPVELR